VKSKNILFLIIGLVVVLFIVLQFVDFGSILNKGYKVEFNPKEIRQKNLFNDKSLLELKPVICEEDTNFIKCLYRDKEFDIFVSEIKGLQNIDLSQLSLSEIDFKEYFNGHYSISSSDYKEYRLLWNAERFNINSVLLVAYENYKKINEYKQSNIYYCSIKSKGISLNKTIDKVLLMFNSKEVKTYNFALVEDLGKYYVVLSANKVKNNKDLLLSYLNKKFL
jgi:hypothetical protein